MKDNHCESKNLVAGVVIGGVIGAAALYFLYKTKHRKTPILQKVGKTIVTVGEMLENCDFDCEGIANHIEKRIPAGSDIVSNAVDWIDMGMKLWKKFK